VTRLQMVGELAQGHRIELGSPGDFQSAMNRAELLDRWASGSASKDAPCSSAS